MQLVLEKNSILSSYSTLETKTFGSRQTTSKNIDKINDRQDNECYRLETQPPDVHSLKNEVRFCFVLFL